jgi:hypothetical protein
MSDNLRADHGWSDVEVHIVAGGRHYLVEENPDEIADLVERHAARRPSVGMNAAEIRAQIDGEWGEDRI